MYFYVESNIVYMYKKFNIYFKEIQIYLSIIEIEGKRLTTCSSIHYFALDSCFLVTLSHASTFIDNYYTSETIDVTFPSKN